ncbi:MAG TPA: ATP-dependent DNA helicase RecG [Nocardioidaceae bacterium]|nr:ATP-dependent DNA helicase RecG [Nocardioidaceae bacterium]
MATLSSKLGSLLGKPTADKIHKAFGYETVGDLLGHYPRTYVDRGQTSDDSEFVEGEVVTLVASVVESKSHTYKDRRTGHLAFRLEVVAQVGQSRVVMTFFDRQKHTAQWRAGKMAPGVTMMVAGKAQWNGYKRSWELVNPHYNDSDLTERSRLLPIYPASSGVTSWAIDDSLALVLPTLDEFPDPLPQELRKERALLALGQAVAWIHAPDDWQQVGAARKRLKFDEAFITQTVLAQRRHEINAVTTRSRTGGGGLLAAFDQRLPFELTRGQAAVCEEILDDLARTHPMHRLLQGEVGSGKTIVALRAMLRVVDSGGQAALLAPTEVLAQQHHRSITAMLGDLAAGGMLGGAEDGTQVALLTGSSNAAARRSALLDAASGAAGIVIGTHALLEERVQFADLGLVVVDEQHRFGVEQRAALAAKGEDPPHVLVMTATPIPRTVAMTVFGDLETSTLTELPAGRAPIQTNVVPLDQPTWINRVWSRAAEEVAKGHQVYVVCPRIDDKASGDDAPPPSDEDDKRPVAAVADVAPRLASELAPLRVEALHGRLPADQKDQVMQAFARGEIDVLVSTTVIEVGVDVPNATMMVILDADRFGVSQLHQLRGRVGRGQNQGLCLLVTGTDRESPSRERLDSVAETTDGFKLSLLDLKQRREGDVLGAAQSGRSSLRLLSVVHDEDVIVEAREAATALVAEDPDLRNHPELAARVADLVESQRADFLEKA